ncbi:hypothetical protein NQ314_005056 [Rhamnusium bicolor]|uniref:Uncharacterized protein n=1 Tax=Rhamnusium bicolor TaxID=1586634 RepID=A0AAV8ZHZ5_9CUCU|nr:hypothetical protein NQ314_005056 [Rhamnusium bicolor]
MDGHSRVTLRLTNSSVELQTCNGFFAIICLGGMVYSYIFVPETFGMRLSDITEYFKERWIYMGYETKEKLQEDSDKSETMTENANDTEKNTEPV